MSTDNNIYTRSIREDTDRMSAVARTADLTSPVAACPGWDVRKVIEHTGDVHRWATRAITTGAAPGRDEDFAPSADDNLAVWIVEGAAALIETLESTAPDAPTWHPFLLEQRAWVWSRRLCLETAMHRWDAEVAANGTSELDAELSSEGIHEYLEMGLPRVLHREKTTPPNVSLHVHCTDVDGEWLIWAEAGNYKMLPVHDKGDAAIRGTAADIWLLVMGRKDRSELDIVGDASAADAWLDLPGW